MFTKIYQVQFPITVDFVVCKRTSLLLFIWQYTHLVLLVYPYIIIVETSETSAALKIMQHPELIKPTNSRATFSE